MPGMQRRQLQRQPESRTGSDERANGGPGKSDQIMSWMDTGICRAGARSVWEGGGLRGMSQLTPVPQH